MILLACDPIFYLHHANMDRVWWSWQARDRTARTKDVSGPLIAMDYTNKRGGNATLDTIMKYESIAASVPVSAVMDIQDGELCYTYETVY